MTQSFASNRAGTIILARDGRSVAATVTDADWASVEVRELRKAYGQVQALKGVSFDVYPGEIVGVLGPNGAGKTTLIEILEGLRMPDDGTAAVLGADVRRSLKSIRDRMGVAMQATALPPLLKVREIIELYTALYSHPRRPDELIELVGLEEKGTSLIRHLSGGQSQRLTVALALVGNPELLFLDEPTSALDPQGRRAIWDVLLDEERRANRTVILATHQMEEAQQLCSRVAVLDHGAILAMDTPTYLIEQHCPGYLIRFETVPDADLTVLETSFEVELTDAARGLVALRADRLEPAMESLMAARRQGLFPVEELQVERKTLEDVFLQLTGRGIRD
ncbi:MAG: ATP-binding cassette domain-containing protein [Dehalococcoidia bacterium]|nr:ATP-binding cassette domain-containing protein [Dehalococcoidia bacterium]